MQNANLVWTSVEDNALKQLYERRRIQKWSTIGELLLIQFNCNRRTGKQCRERYHMIFNPDDSNDFWSIEDDKKLFQLHDNLGNQWAKIRERMGTKRTDNSIKNHYFSRLRKSLRRINKMIQLYFKSQFRSIQQTVIYKIIEASEEKFKIDPMCQTQVSESSCQIKNRILNLLDFEEQTVTEEYINHVKQLITDILDFSRNYKRKPKKLRRGKSLYVLNLLDTSTNLKKRKNSHCSDNDFNSESNVEQKSKEENNFDEDQSEDYIQYNKKESISNSSLMFLNHLNSNMIEEKDEKEDGKKVETRQSERIEQSEMECEQNQFKCYRYFEESEMQVNILMPDLDKKSSSDQNCLFR